MWGASSGSDIGVFKKGMLLRANSAFDVSSYPGGGVFVDSAIGVLEHSLNRAFTKTRRSYELFNGNTVGVADLHNSIRQIESTPSYRYTVKGRHNVRDAYIIHVFAIFSSFRLLELVTQSPQYAEWGHKTPQQAKERNG